jgi:hypothetical protein
MPLWSINPNETLTILCDWAVFKCFWKDTKEPTIHVVGFAVYNSEGRISSPVLEIDPKLRQFKTRSRVYQLQDTYNRSLESLSGDALYVYNSWVYLNKNHLLQDNEDITTEYV